MQIQQTFVVLANGSPVLHRAGIPTLSIPMRGTAPSPRKRSRHVTQHLLGTRHVIRQNVLRLGKAAKGGLSSYKRTEGFLKNFFLLLNLTHSDLFGGEGTDVPVTLSARSSTPAHMWSFLTSKLHFMFHYTLALEWINIKVQNLLFKIQHSSWET